MYLQFALTQCTFETRRDLNLKFHFILFVHVRCVRVTRTCTSRHSRARAAYLTGLAFALWPIAFDSTAIWDNSGARAMGVFGQKPQIQVKFFCCRHVLGTTSLRALSMKQSYTLNNLNVPSARLGTFICNCFRTEPNLYFPGEFNYVSHD